MTRPDGNLTWLEFLSAAGSLAAQRGPAWVWVNVLRRPWARWLAVGTRNRTVHVFGVNPYGGKPDVRSHVEGRVRNVDVIVRNSFYIWCF